MSRLDIIDAAFHYASKDLSRDQYVLLAFGWPGDAPASFEEIAEFVCSRAARVPELRTRLQEVPGNLDYPRWVHDDRIHDGASLRSRVVDLPSQTWEDVPRAVEGLVQIPVDAAEAPWRVHVACDVEGVPHADGKAAVVVFQVSHALTDGRGASRLARLLFTPTLPSGPTTGSVAAAPGTQLPHAVSSLLELPYRLLAARVGAARARRAFVRAHGVEPTSRDAARPAVRGNAAPMRSRVVHMIACPPGAFRRASFSVTTCALTAVSLATDRYLADAGDTTPDSLNALVPMALPEEVRWPAVNRIVNGSVDLHVEIDDLTERAGAIRASLSAARTAVVDPLLTRWIRAENKIPAPIFLAFRRRGAKHARPSHDLPEAVLTNVTVVSVDRGDAGIELCGARPIMTAGFPMLGPARSLSHGFYGIGNTVTVCVTACPETFPDHARYVEFLEKAVADVLEATTVPN